MGVEVQEYKSCNEICLTSDHRPVTAVLLLGDEEKAWSLPKQLTPTHIMRKLSSLGSFVRLSTRIADKVGPWATACCAVDVSRGKGERAAQPSLAVCDEQPTLAICEQGQE